ncbi:SRPBCC family protein [Leekyejoonella antrihumi]|uniref:Activator of Hsp90 ATPase homologue 1/2-like C-terminal domain-containing protein n=1 Tax=Leekyejoonella antrihumi TaxID=1660198 RepID=A0A563E2X9_9MICO|nr:SRPBCC family protein [Leekyejoonella antrihumi]TWP36244.1 hypothetical protein FGL98_11150 [Leekyejoonella antrihumi]
MIDDVQDPIQRVLGGTPDQPSLTFERRFRTTPADLWEAITDPERLSRWFGRLDTAVPQRVGDRFGIHLGDDEDHAVGVITACRPPEHLAYEWAWQGERTSLVDVTLTAGDGHTTLLLTHRLTERDHAVEYGGGWEELLGSLANQLSPATRSDHDAATTEAEGNRQWSQLLELRDTAADLRLTRTLPAIEDDVWRALTTREGLAAWWWPSLGTTYELATHVGGHYRFTAGQAGFAVHGTYLEIDEGRHLACSWIWQDADGDRPVDRVDITLSPTDEGSGTNLEVWHRGPWTDRSQVENYRLGWTSTLDALTSRLAAPQVNR